MSSVRFQKENMTLKVVSDMYKPRGPVALLPFRAKEVLVYVVDKHQNLRGEHSALQVAVDLRSKIVLLKAVFLVAQWTRA